MLGPAVVDGWELIGKPPRRGTTGQFAPFAVQVSLVVEATAGRHLGQGGPIGCLEQAVRDLEPHHPARHLGRQTELATEALTEMPPTPADFLGQRRHPDLAVAGGEPPPGPPELRRRSFALPGDPWLISTGMACRPLASVLNEPGGCAGSGIAVRSTMPSRVTMKVR